MIEIMDTTLRDGEQTSGVSFTVREKLSIAKLLLDELHVDRIEIASARVSEGEAESTRLIAAWAREQGFIDRIEVLGFVDGGVLCAAHDIDRTEGLFGRSGVRPYGPDAGATVVALPDLPQIWQPKTTTDD